MKSDFLSNLSAKQIVIFRITVRATVKLRLSNVFNTKKRTTKEMTLRV